MNILMMVFIVIMALSFTVVANDKPQQDKDPQQQPVEQTVDQQ